MTGPAKVPVTSGPSARCQAGTVFHSWLSQTVVTLLGCVRSASGYKNVYLQFFRSDFGAAASLEAVRIYLQATALVPFAAGHGFPLPTTAEQYSHLGEKFSGHWSLINLKSARHDCPICRSHPIQECIRLEEKIGGCPISVFCHGFFCISKKPRLLIGLPAGILARPFQHCVVAVLYRSRRIALFQRFIPPFATGILEKSQQLMNEYKSLRMWISKNSQRPVSPSIIASPCFLTVLLIAQGKKNEFIAALSLWRFNQDASETDLAISSTCLQRHTASIQTLVSSGLGLLRLYSNLEVA